MGGEACGDTFLLTIFSIINKVVLIAKVAVPLIIIVTTMFDIINDVLGKEVKYKTTLDRVKYRLLAAVLIFFMPNIINLGFKLVDSDYSENNIECLLHVTSSDVESARIAEVSRRIEQISVAIKSGTSYDQNELDEISLLATGIEDESLREKYTQDIQELRNLQEETQQEQIEAERDERLKAILEEEQQVQKEAGTDISLGQNKGGVTYDRPFIGVKLKYYAQNSDQYKAVKYTYSGKEYTHDTAGCGCGYVSLSMIIDSINGTSLTPTGVINDFTPKIHGNCAISDATLQDIYHTPGKLNKDYGLSVRLLFGREYTNKRQTDSMKQERKNKIVEALKHGESIILLIPGHYIVLGSMDTNGLIAVHDPSNSNNNGWFTIDQIYDYHEDHAERCSKGRPDTDSNGNIKYENGKIVMYHRCGFQMAIAYKGKNSISTFEEYYEKMAPTKPGRQSSLRPNEYEQ